MKSPDRAAEGISTGGNEMIGKKGDIPVSNSAPGDVRAILGKGSEFEGKLRFEGTVRIDGKFRGEVHSEGTIIVGESAAIEGDLEVNSAIVSGEIRGNINAKTRVEMQAPAKLFGNIQTPVLVIQEGVIFEGHCQMTKEGSKGRDSFKPGSGSDQAGADAGGKKSG